mgnify:CR=1 FL=1
MKAYAYYLGLALLLESCITIKVYQSEAEEVAGTSPSTEIKTMLPMGKTVTLEGEPHPLYFFGKDEALKLDVFPDGSVDSLTAKTIRIKIKQETDSLTNTWVSKGNPLDMVSQDMKGALLIINGEAMPKGTAMPDWEMDNIETIEVLKGVAAVKKYGTAAAQGVIEIKLKE